MNMVELLKEVGRGKRGARDLTYEEAASAARLILTQTATPAQIGAFLTAERIKIENVDELKAFVDVCRSFANRSAGRDGIDFAGPYDGRTSTFMATFACAFIVASCGLPVTLHGTEPLPPKRGITIPMLLREMGIDSARVPRRQAAAAAALTGVMFVSSEQECPPLGRLRPLREELGLRTVLNTAEKLIDYSCSPYLAFGVFHNTVFERTAKLLVKLGYRKAVIVQGCEGSEDLFIERPTRTYVVENGEARLELIDPEMFGLESVLPELSWTPALQLEVTEQVLNGTGHMAFTNQVLLNSAVRLYIGERVQSIEEGIYTCKSVLESGAALDSYQRWRTAMLDGQMATTPSATTRLLS